MPRKGYYSPPLRRDLVKHLYFAARDLRVPMTVRIRRLFHRVDDEMRAVHGKEVAFRQIPTGNKERLVEFMSPVNDLALNDPSRVRIKRVAEVMPASVRFRIRVRRASEQGKPQGVAMAGIAVFRVREDRSPETGFREVRPAVAGHFERCHLDGVVECGRAPCQAEGHFVGGLTGVGIDRELDLKELVPVLPIDFGVKLKVAGAGFQEDPLGEGGDAEVIKKFQACSQRPALDARAPCFALAAYRPFISKRWYKKPAPQEPQPERKPMSARHSALFRA